MLLKFELKPLFLYYLMNDEFEISSGRLLLLKNALDDSLNTELNTIISASIRKIAREMTVTDINLLGNYLFFNRSRGR